MGMTSSKGSKTKAALRATSPGAGHQRNLPAHPKKREETSHMYLLAPTAKGGTGGKSIENNSSFRV